MIQLNNIYKYIDKRFQRTFILKDVNLQIKEGEFITIMGPSGAGKSTLLNILGFLDDPSEGEYLFLDETVHNLSEKRKSDYHKSHIGFVFQAYHLIDELTVYENIEMPLLYRKIKSKQRKAMVADILDRFNIVAKKDLFPPQLSGGQQQVVGVAPPSAHHRETNWEQKDQSASINPSQPRHRRPSLELASATALCGVCLS